MERNSRPLNEVAVSLWPTPSASVPNDGESPLSVAGKLWPTPTASDANASGSFGYSTDSGRHAGTTLTDATVRTSGRPAGTTSKAGRATSNASQGELPW